MTEQEFRKEMDRVKSTWGPKSFNETRIHRVWLFCKDLDWKDLNEIVNRFLDTMSFAPKPQDFDEASRPFRFKRVENTQSKIKSTNECEHCCDTGFLNMEKPDFKHLAVRCFCKEGLRSDYKSIPRVKDLSESKPFENKLFVPCKNETVKQKSDRWVSFLKKSKKYWIENPVEPEDERYWWLK